MKKCPTGLRFDKYKLTNKMGKHLFATYRSYAPKKERDLIQDGVWPLGPHATEFYR